MTRKFLILPLSLCMALISHAATYEPQPLSPDSAVVAKDIQLSRFFKEAYGTPATIQFRLPFSINSIGAGYDDCAYSQVFDNTRGSGSRDWHIGAEAYTKYKSSTLFGSASYTGGKQYDLKWIENADPEIVYPYFSADSIGGDLTTERYRFAGGYSDRSDRWLWGVMLSYDAGLSYRSVDPRPRNVTGLLSISASGGYRFLKDYNASLTLLYKKYKQSNDIDFFSEMGETKIFHATGLGTHYQRFAGNGKESHYGGDTFGASAALTPGYSAGFIAFFGWSRFSFDKILADLNKLPLAKAVQNTLRAEIGYRSANPLPTASAWSSQWAVKASFASAKRTGTENIFGDPASGIYPLTGSREMYHSYNYDVSLSGLWQMTQGVGRHFSVTPEVAYFHRHENYMNPVRIMTIDRFRASLLLESGFTLPLGLKGTASASAMMASPVKKQLSISRLHVKDDEGLTAAARSRYNTLSRHHAAVGAGFGLSRRISSRFAIGASVQWQHTFYSGDIHGNVWNATANLYF